MRKLATLALAVLMVVSLLAVSAAAESYTINESCNAKFEIKKADPANVIKDGKIGEGEYTQITVDDGDLTRNFIDSAVYENSEAMATTIKYYFSWDEVHGLNFAVVFDAGEGFRTSIDQGTPNEEGKPMDDFCYNLGLNFTSGRTDDNMPYFYYSIGKKIQDGSYLTGHWGQLGATGTYNAVGGQDFEVSYSGTVATFEWSIPLDVLNVSATAGSNVEINIAATAGSFDYDPETMAQPGDAKKTWGVSLGQFGFLCQSGKENTAAIGTLSAEVIPGPNGNDNPETTTAPSNPDGVTTTAPSNPDDVTTTVAPTNTNVEEQTSIKEVEIVVTNENGETETDAEGNVITEKVTEIVKVPGTTTTSPVTGDPAIIAAVVAAISACGVVVAKKRK